MLRNPTVLRIMSHMKSHEVWFKTVTDGASGRAAALAAGVSVATLNRQLARGEIDPAHVIAIARAYGADPAEALAITGYLTPAEAAPLGPVAAMRLATDQALIRELARRIDSNAAAWSGTFGDVLDSAETGPPLKAVADGSPDEPEDGTDFD